MRSPERLGVGERQLRRLFQQHLGASPVAVAQTRRVLFAKQLIHETRLPMTEVAFAAGFGSIRRFNETFRALVRPSAERAAAARQAAAGGSAGPSGESACCCATSRPTTGPAMLAFLAARAIAGVEEVAEDVLPRTIARSEAGTVEVVRTSPRDGQRLRVNDSLPEAARPAGHHRAPAPRVRPRRRSARDRGPSRPDPVPGAARRARPGLRVPGAWDGFELAVRAVLGQQITVAAARGSGGPPGGRAWASASAEPHARAVARRSLAGARGRGGPDDPRHAASRGGRALGGRGGASRGP